METQRRRFEDDDTSNDSSSTRSTRTRRKQFRINDIKVDILDFEGKLQPDEVVEWLQIVERVFEYKEVPEEQKVKIIVVKLKKYALIWWENLKRKCEREGKNKIRT